MSKHKAPQEDISSRTHHTNKSENNGVDERGLTGGHLPSGWRKGCDRAGRRDANAIGAVGRRRQIGRVKGVGGLIDE